MTQLATRAARGRTRSARVLCAIATCALSPACHRADPGPVLQILGDDARVRSGAPVPRTSPYFDGQRVALVAARGEVLGLVVVHRGGGDVSLDLPGARVALYDTLPVTVRRPSTQMYGGSLGPGAYADGLAAAAGAAHSDPAYVEIAIDRAAAPGPHDGTLVVDARRIPVHLDVAAVTLPPLPLSVWAYEDPRELGSTLAQPTDAERACIAMFRGYGVLLSPDMPPDVWAARAPLLAGFPYVPAVIPDDPAAAGAAVRAWIANTEALNSEHVPFAIPIDEPHGAAAKARVHALAAAAHAAGAGPGRFLYAVTADPPLDPDVDLYITLHAKLADGFARWTYNGAPPHAGSMVVDAAPPGLRTWGWIGWRWHIPVWYVWDALYWHDRHNRHGAPGPGRALDLANAVSFDDGDDHGNLDGVLALPGDATTPCRPTLRLAALRRGLEDRALLELAARCQPDAVAALAERMVPRALGDAADGDKPAWSADEAAWEAARRRLIELAASCEAAR